MCKTCSTDINDVTECSDCMEGSYPEGGECIYCKEALNDCLQCVSKTECTKCTYYAVLDANTKKCLTC